MTLFDQAAPSIETDGYRGKQACGIVGITYRQLDYWARTDLIRPSIADAAGSGSQRLYSYLDLVSLKVIKSLLDAGISLQLARRAIEYLHEHLGDDLPSAHLVIDGSTVLLKRDDELIDLIRAGQGVLNIIPLGPVVQAIDAGIPELRLAEARVAELAANA
ncbi:MAG: MerR family transcriptional regulator [Acidimicrobiia bacterium]